MRVGIHYHYIISFILLIFINSCTFKEPVKNHGIIFLENRSEKIFVKKSNKNDVIKIFGQPHTKSLTDKDLWIYIERVLTKGEYHKLGQNVLKTNNVLILKFDKYGILQEKKFLNKDDKNKMAFSDKKTENKLTQKSFIEKFLSSMRTKMYGNK
mgnify:CR=1 FL=1|tara:strand:- start:3 stop:464 length:462 start_codon:yes stop_codon:yes gene_type:complete